MLTRDPLAIGPLSPPPLISFEVPTPRLTLLDIDDSLGEDTLNPPSDSIINGLRTQAKVFVPRSAARAALPVVATRPYSRSSSSNQRQERRAVVKKQSIPRRSDRSVSPRVPVSLQTRGVDKPKDLYHAPWAHHAQTPRIPYPKTGSRTGRPSVGEPGPSSYRFSPRPSYSPPRRSTRGPGASPVSPSSRRRTPLYPLVDFESPPSARRQTFSPSNAQPDREWVTDTESSYSRSSRRLEERGRRNSGSEYSSESYRTKLSEAAELTPPTSFSSRPGSPSSETGSRRTIPITPEDDVKRLFVFDPQSDNGRLSAKLKAQTSSREGLGLDDRSISRVSGRSRRSSSVSVADLLHLDDMGDHQSTSALSTPAQYRYPNDPRMTRLGRRSPANPDHLANLDNIVSPYHVLLSQPSPRENIPKHLLDPTPPDALQSSLLHAWALAEPTAEKRAYIGHLLRTLSAVINQRFGGHQYGTQDRFEVDVFGSVSWAGETGSSGDLDLVILDKRMPQGYHPSLWRVPPGSKTPPPGRFHSAPKKIPSLPALYNVHALASVLANCNMQDIEPITHANVPIVKFKSPERPGRNISMSCDINVNDLGGWYNSSLILHYCLQAPHVLRPMIHGLKLWAAAFEVNDASGARGLPTMSSYCLTLMAIAYLQYRGVLPNLQRNIMVPDYNDPQRDDPDAVWVSFGKLQGTKAMVGFDNTIPPPPEDSQNQITAADALRGFFAFFSTTPETAGSPRMQYQTEMLSILNGGVIPRAHGYLTEDREEATRRNQYIDMGITEDRVKQIMREEREQRLAIEARMGTGNGEIQPRNWGASLLIVQDPFLWSKNCAATLSKGGYTRLFAAIDHTHKRLVNERRITLEAVISNPNPPQNRAPTPYGGAKAARAARAAQNASRASSERSKSRGSTPHRS